jgi:Transposase IS4
MFCFIQVRPIIDNLNKASSKWHGGAEKFSVDEVMVPYYGRHGSKQYIHGKPVRYGFKVSKTHNI